MAAFILVMSNIIIMLIGYLIMNYRLKKRYINEDILNSIRSEINELIRQMNESTVQNIDLVNNSKIEMNALVKEKETQVTEMLLNIEKKIRVIDDRMKQLKSLSPEQADLMRKPVIDTAATSDENVYAAKTYNYINVINKSNAAAAAKRQAEDEEKRKQKELEDKLSSMEVSDQIGYLSEIGKSHSEIKKILGVSDGEIELSISLYKSRSHNDLL